MSEPAPTVEELEARADALEHEAKWRQDALASAEKHERAVRAPYEARVRAIYEEMAASVLVKDAEAASKAARTALWARYADTRDSIAGAAQKAREAATAARTALTVPTDEESYLAFLKGGAPPFNLRRTMGITTRASPLTSDTVLLAGAEEYGDKCYLAVRGKGSKARIVGWLRVSPAEHRGDSTRAVGRVNDQPFLAVRTYSPLGWRLAEGTEYAKRPLSAFKAAVRGEDPIEAAVGEEEA